MLGPTLRAALGARTARRIPILFAVVAAAAAPGAAAPPAGDGAETETPVVRDELTVTDTRLRDRPTASRRVPAHVTVLDRERIEAAGAVNPQELVALEAGVVLFDATGSNLQKTLDLRGFTGGGVKVFLDGAPLNDPRNNALSLELINPEALDRVEIGRGSRAALAGGGSQAGVINLWTRRGGDRGGRLRLAGGGFDTRDGSLAGWGRAGGGDWFGVASLYDGDGYRDNGGARLGRLTAGAGRSLAGGELRLSLLGGAGKFGNPGALRPDELAADRRQAPFNRLDFSDERLAQATLNFDRLFASDLSLRANLFARQRRRESLTTGRAAPLFGGFFLDSDTGLAGATAQLGRLGRRHELEAGFDWLDADTDAAGFSTPADDPGRVAPRAASSDNLTTRRTLAVYLQDRWRPAEGLTLTFGARWDEDRVGYRERLPDPTLADRRTYSELSLRAGLSWSPAPGQALWAAFGEAFLPPTVEELFSFPLFGSNPELEPEDSRSIEVGWRRAGSRHQLETALFRLDTRDEIVFDPDSPAGLFGANVNAGRARRQGLELAYRGRPRDGLRWFATATFLEAELRGGPDRGKTVPLVPERRLALGAELTVAPGLVAAAEGLRVGEQVLDNDGANRQPPLAAYTVVGARLAWEPRPAARTPALPRFTLRVRNLFDADYETRGIFAFDFSTFSNAVFLTPAPDRQLTLALEWDL